MNRWLFVAKTTEQWQNPHSGQLHQPGEILALSYSTEPPGWSRDVPAWRLPHPFLNLANDAGDSLIVMLIDPETIPFSHDALLEAERREDVWGAKYLYDRLDFEPVDSFQRIRIVLPDGVHAGKAMLKESVA